MILVYTTILMDHIHYSFELKLHLYQHWCFPTKHSSINPEIETSTTQKYLVCVSVCLLSCMFFSAAIGSCNVRNTDTCAIWS